MVADLPSFYLFLLVVILPLVYLAFSRRRSGSGQRLPPSPWALPVIGHLHHLAGALPHRALRDLARRHGPLMLLRFGEVPVVVASSPDAAREIMKTHDVAFATRPVGPMLRRVFQGAEGLVFAPYGDAWRQLRKICTVEILSSRRVQSFRAVREDELGRLLRSVASEAEARPVVNLSARIAAFVADSSVRAIIGCRNADRDAFLRILEDGMKVVPGMSLPDIFPSSRIAMRLSRVPGMLQRGRSAMLGFVDTIIKERQENIAAAAAGEEHEDLLDVLLRLQKEMGSQYPLTTLNIKTVIIDLFVAGSETSSTMLQWAMAELMRNPTVMRRAQEEVRRELAGHDRVTEDSLRNLHYMRLVIKETLRLHPAAPLLVPRECRSPCEVLGFDVPQGAMVLVNAWAIGRDPAHWDAPEEFVPERFEERGGSAGRDFKGTDFEFVPFGAGRRMCPGMAFGLAHIELALAALLFHFDWDLPEGMVREELDMTEAAGITARLRSDLLVVAVPRAPVPSE
ncbi:desmethyl-deoxy-podophyllotoxin synthase-like [Lolium rigidum]|uniref:desmethyl-deoxy-podophyllotoxin synthase-like n=1 Tax=Lolium rigidum TaxID=89674 RepID=UPI001F5CB48B|nr:desmethyl-deoxy-podophyllotoxin synthase-like [Lolium rigidum]